MSPENNPPPPPPSTKPTSKDDGGSSQGSGGRKTATARPPEQGLKCPRCDSPNTKFCYYNNYSLTQPRHFCKTCRRYWTKGGALRNVPIGGGCRKNKKVKSSSSSSSSRFPGDPMGSPELGGFKFLHSLSPSSMDFNLSGSSTSSSFPRLHHHHNHPHHPSMYNQISSFENLQLQPPTSFETSNSSNPMMMSNFNNNYPSTGFGGVIQGMSSMNVNSNLASSIESLSSVNQDLHWKLQQQRLAMLFGGDIDNDNDNNVNNQKSSDDGGATGVTTSLEKPQPILFQNLEISKPESCGVGSRKDDMNNNANNAPTEWFFGNSFASVIPTPSNSNGGGGGGVVHGWSDVQQQQQPYNALP